MMPPRHDRRRLDKLLVAATAISFICTILTVGVIAPTVLNVNKLTAENRELAERIVKEGRERRDQTCTQAEREHLGHVTRLRRTYDYLAQLPREEWGSSLTVAIVRELPEIERQARSDVAPEFCDEPGIGLPEPDPELPAPQGFDRLLERP